MVVQDRPSTSQRDHLTRRYRVASENQPPAAAQVVVQNKTTILHNRDNILLTSPASLQSMADKGSPPPLGDLSAARLAVWITSVSPTEVWGERGNGVVGQRLRRFQQQSPVKEQPLPVSSKQKALETVEKRRLLEQQAKDEAIARANAKWEQDQAQICHRKPQPSDLLWLHGEVAQPATSLESQDASGWARLGPSVQWPRLSREAVEVGGEVGSSRGCKGDGDVSCPHLWTPRLGVAVCICLLLLLATLAKAFGELPAVVHTPQRARWGDRWARVPRHLPRSAATK